jgi:adenylate cyclase
MVARFRWFKKDVSNNKPEFRSAYSGRSLVEIMGLLSILTISVFATGSAIGIVQRWEQRLQTIFLELRGNVKPSAQIIIVEIDNASLGAADLYAGDPTKQEVVRLLGNEFPWRREAYARVIDYLMTAGARSVSIDLLFESTSRFGNEDDQRFRKTLERYPNMITLAAAYDESSGMGSMNFVQPIAVLRSPSTRLGLVNFLKPANQPVLRLGSAYNEQIVRPLNLEIFPPFAEATLQTAQLNNYSLPKGDRIYFYGPRKTFKSISFWQLLASDWQKVFHREHIFKDKIVLIGTTSSIFKADQFRTPMDDNMPGVELQANAISTLLEERSIAQVFPYPWVEAGFVGLLLSGVGMILLRLGRFPVWQLFIGCGVAICWSITSYLAFTYGYWLLPTVVPLVGILLSTILIFTVEFVDDRLEMSRLRRTLERYIAAPVVKEILKRPDTMLIGQSLEVAVMFADIRGFTHLSYQLPPEQLMTQLNQYFNALVEIILQEGGTVDKFIGDAIMAEFGFPVSQGKQQDALNAIRAALGMRAALAELRSRFVQEGWEPFFNGIGISFGKVIAGDLGALKRREYGVIGDTVNVASRVEGLTKQFSTDILITESLYELVKEEVEVVSHGEHQLRGREKGLVKVYGLIGLKGDDKTCYKQVIQDLHAYLGMPPT